MNKLLKINYALYIGVFMVSLLVFVAIFGSILAPYSLTDQLEAKYEGGTIIAPPIEPFEMKEYLLGTNRWGYDLLTYILHGLKYTVFVSIVVTVLKMAAGTLIGLYAGMMKRVPGWVEAFEKAWSYVPLFIILYFFLLPISFNPVVTPMKLIIYFIVITAAISTPSIVSSVRKKTAEINKSVFIEAARTLGAGRNRLIWHHIFPQLKESLTVMFILEIVYVITIMGQLALVNIFVGGTKVTYDPLLYYSMTNELAGLVGQARGNIYGTYHVLTVPLTVLLVTTLSFSLLANGLKNRFQSNYQRMPWIKTGFEPVLQPKRKEYGEAKKNWPPRGERLALFLLILFLLVSGTFVYATRNSDIGVKNYSRADYDIHLKMDEAGKFTVDANIDVKNLSNKEWKEAVFYFIPNSFSEGHPYKTVKGHSAVEFQTIKVEGKKTSHTLENDTLKVNLPKKIKKRDKAKISFSYTMELPEEGSRLSRVGDRYYLAQWYPMLATFQDGKWNKEAFTNGLETFHTGFSDYHITYELPKGYSFISTSDADPKPGIHSGQVKSNKVRDFFIAIVKDVHVYETESNGVAIRLFTKTDHNKDPELALQLAKNALSFYQKKIGDYPHSQLDLILDLGQNMEYPGAVTVNPYHENDKFFKIAIVHEIAHQYFYGVVANDSFNEPWIDEGITEFATNMYFYIKEDEPLGLAQELSINRMKSIEQEQINRQYSNTPVDQLTHSGFVYGQPAINLYKLAQENYPASGHSDVKTAAMDFLSGYYNRFKYKEVNTAAFIKYSMEYFNVPRAYFNDWLGTEVS
ncbi:ABC transporter permease subunit [Neobacillus notoginsengisoli]|uniref:ABC transporter permease subunit n=1 Tax=Neobacillus notoginsengisoli TaxID=1578198 RepID=A0A417YVJ2_9BACI|nr:ABC transporter permease subunit [Neobacillus notoginsengisoli]RHW41290.1 ABC transporter permease subunit [Neobacillus notoginsengisoli]